MTYHYKINLKIKLKTRYKESWNILALAKTNQSPWPFPAAAVDAEHG